MGDTEPSSLISSGCDAFRHRELVTTTITVPVIGDTLDELDENFFVVLSNPVGATFGIDQVVAAMQNDARPHEEILEDLPGAAQLTGAPSIEDAVRNVVCSDGTVPGTHQPR